jgi:hypothetical protein
MKLFQGLLFLILGVGLIVVAMRSLASGWLPCGPNGLKGRLEFRRNERPVLYWLMFVVYGVAGFWLAIFALWVLLGTVPPLPLS